MSFEEKGIDEILRELRDDTLPQMLALDDTVFKNICANAGETMSLAGVTVDEQFIRGCAVMLGIVNTWEGQTLSDRLAYGMVGYTPTVLRTASICALVKMHDDGLADTLSVPDDLSELSDDET